MGCDGLRVPPIQRPAETVRRFVELFEHRPVTSAEAVAHGFTRGQLDAARRRGLLVSPKYGLLQAAAGLRSAETPHRDRPAIEAAHLALVRATLVSVRDEVLVAGDSAAIVHGLARPLSTAPAQVLLVRPDGSGYSGGQTRRRGSPVPRAQRAVVDGIPVTSLERTAVDVARGHALASALVPLDSAARLMVARETDATGNRLREYAQVPELRRLSSARLETALLAIRGWAGTVRVRNALPHIHPASESAHESRSRGWFIEGGLGALNPGTPVACDGTTYWADFCDPRRRVIGEADGWGKYGVTEESVRRAVDDERRRQAELESEGWRFVRWSTSTGRAAVVARMSRALSAQNA